MDEIIRGMLYRISEVSPDNPEEVKSEIAWMLRKLADQIDGKVSVVLGDDDQDAYEQERDEAEADA